MDQPTHTSLGNGTLLTMGYNNLMSSLSSIQVYAGANPKANANPNPNPLTTPTYTPTPVSGGGKGSG